MKKDEYRDLQHLRVEFDKCIDKQAYLILSTKMEMMPVTSSNADLRNLIKDN
jgi:hypothetical protein